MGDSMPESKIQIRIITPEDTKADEKADMIIMRAITGPMGILPGHAPYTSVLDIGALQILDGENIRKIALFGGIAEIRDDVLTILTPFAEWPEDIDRAHAEADREHARHRLQENVDDMEIQRDQVLLRRSLVRIEVSSDSLVSESGLNEEL